MFYFYNNNFFIKIKSVHFESRIIRMHFFLHFSSKKFGGFKKMYYLCRRFNKQNNKTIDYDKSTSNFKTDKVR